MTIEAGTGTQYRGVVTDRSFPALPEFERLYKKYNRREFVAPDPLQFLYDYPDVADREIAALIASSLAYGRVAQILASIGRVLNILGPSPHRYLVDSSESELLRQFDSFKHRFTTGAEMVSLLAGIKHAMHRYGSLNRCFTAGMKNSDPDILRGLQHFVEEINGTEGHPLPLPSRGSACKKLNLFLRWMVRKDPVDPGGWEGIDPAMLIIPLDTHIARIGADLGLTCRKSQNMAMAIEITNAFKQMVPDDPVKYDFVLTRFGIRSDLDVHTLLHHLHSVGSG